MTQSVSPSLDDLGFDTLERDRLDTDAFGLETLDGLEPLADLDLDSDRAVRPLGEEALAAHPLVHDGGNGRRDPRKAAGPRTPPHGGGEIGGARRRGGASPQSSAPRKTHGAMSDAVPDIAGARPRGEPRAHDQGEADEAHAARGRHDAEAAASPSPSRATCTAPQLRRFIKSRVYIPMHELRRRFAINGHDDDVCVVEVDARRIYVGLPPAEGRLLGELLRNGEVGYELSMDPETPVVVGVYSMRPVSRS